MAGAASWTACSHRRAPNPNAERAPLDFTLKDASGRDVSLSSFRGRPLVINFWATYCGPCKAEIPLLNELVQKYRSEHLAVVGISYDDAPADIAKFLQTNSMNYPVLVGLGHDDMMSAYQADVALPTTWVVASDGTVVAKYTGPQTREWFEAQIKAAF